MTAAGSSISIFRQAGSEKLATKSRINASSKRTVILLVATLTFLALLLRGGLLFVGPWQDTSRAVVGDSPRYLELASNLVATGSFGLAGESSGLVHIPLRELRESLGQSPASVAAGLEAEGFRTPGYVLFLAGFDLLNLDLRWVLLTQVVMSSVVVALIAWLTWTVSRSTRVVVGVALLLALNPGSVIEANLVLSEGLFTFLLIASLCLAQKARLSRHWLAIVFTGLCLAATILVRPVALVAVPVVGLMLLTKAQGSTSAGIKQRVAQVALFALVTALPLVAWGARNDHVGYGPKLSTVPDVNAWFYTAAHLDLYEQSRDLQADWPAAVEQQIATLTAHASPDESVFDTARHLATRRIAGDPLLYLTVLGRSVTKFFTDHSMTETSALLGTTWQPTGLRSTVLSGDVGAILKRPQAMLPLIWMGFNALLVAAAAIGFVQLCRAGQWRIACCFALLIAGFAFATQTNGLERFRWPVAPLQLLMAAAVLLPLRHPRRVFTPGAEVS